MKNLPIYAIYLIFFLSLMMGDKVYFFVSAAVVAAVNVRIIWKITKGEIKPRA